MNSYEGVVKKPLLVSELKEFECIDKIIIDSLEQALYRVEVIVDDDVFYLLEKPGKNLTRRSIVGIQKLFISYYVKEMFLRHRSPYDEMIGLTEEGSNNELLVPVGNYFTHESQAIIH